MPSKKDVHIYVDDDTGDQYIFDGKNLVKLPKGGGPGQDGAPSDGGDDNENDQDNSEDTNSNSNNDDSSEEDNDSDNESEDNSK